MLQKKVNVQITIATKSSPLYRSTLFEIFHRKSQKCSGACVPRKFIDLWINHKQGIFYVWKCHARMHKYLENFYQS